MNTTPPSKHLSGIYIIRSKCKPERCYIGSAVKIHDRKKKHLSDLRLNHHHSKKLQYHYNKYGENDLVFSVLICCNKDALITYEQFFIDSHNPFFNICKIAKSCLGMKLSPEAVEKIRKANKGKHHSLETRLKISEIQKGRHLSTETKLKIRASARRGEKHHMFGKHHSIETKLKWSKIRTGRKPTDEARRNQSEAQKGRVISDETKRKIGDANRGRRHSEETKQKLRVANLGKNSPLKGTHMSEESKRKMSEARKRYLSTLHLINNGTQAITN